MSNVPAAAAKGILRRTLRQRDSSAGWRKCVAVKLNRLAPQAFLDRGRSSAPVDEFNRGKLKSTHGSTPAVPRMPPGQSSGDGDRTNDQPDFELACTDHAVRSIWDGR